MKFIYVASILTVCYQYRTLAADPIGTGGPSVVFEGKDALLTCVVTGPYLNDTVLWRKGPRNILSAGINRVTNDKRISILHDDSPKGRAPTGGDVWVLLIKDTKPSDTDVYVCEVNSDPVVRSFHPLMVKSANTSLPAGGDVDGLSTSPDVPPPLPSSTIVPSLSHDFTECCELENVTSQCMGFCNVHNILDGTTGIEPEACEKDFPSIVKCMADGRNHIPCCEGRDVPDLCQDMCRGEYTPFTDFLKSRVSCVRYTLPGLQCILEGVQKLPSMPQDVYAEPLTEKSLEIGWSPPAKLGDTVKHYIVNVTALHVFDQDKLPNHTLPPTVSVTVPGEQRSTVINDLKPFTMYSITVSAYNEHGSSLPSFRIRALTLDSGIGRQTSVAVVPVLPDVRGCCERNGMSHRMCLDKMCDPKKTDLAEIPDFMVCAPWANITFSCLTNNIDHTPCCKSRGIPTICLPLCSGNVTTIDFSLFKCLRYMSDYSSCLLQGYGVLAGPPSRLRPNVISSHFAILEWNSPKILPDTVTSFHVYYRKLGSGDEYSAVEKEHPPVILEGLDAGVYYEVFVVAMNAHGKGGPSPRLVFRTKFQENIQETMPSYNMTQCCTASGLLPQCMPLCSYDLRMSDMQALGATCQAQMGTIARCAAGGRDHTPCCNRRGVIPGCISLCRGVLPPTMGSSDCLSYAGNILQCFEEGTGNIPGPVEDVHVTSVTNNSISLAWVPSEEDVNNTEAKYIDFLVQYGKVNNMTMYETVVKLENELNTTETEIELNNLEPLSLYRILVVARGKHGSSLPSSMLIINTTNLDSSSAIYGAPSPPHSLSITAHSATWVTISWQPPEFSHPHESISYKIYHKPTSADKFSLIETRLLWTRLNNLKPNSQHVIYVEAVGAKGTSLPSETLVAWTDPALPAFVDPPTIHPADIVAEGGSMTILCLALGNPAPTISLYVGGHLVRQDTSRHMVTVIHNVTADMDHVSCYADNGYGVPMQSSRKVNISYPPRVHAAGITVAYLGEEVDLKCTVKAKPTPKAIFWRDHDGRVPVIQGGNYDMSLTHDESDPSLYIMNLHISKLQSSDVGDYFCHAENALGSATIPVSVRVRNTPAAHNITECCMSQNVSSVCMAACSFYIDIDAVIDRTECIVDFDKLMKCAADGSDHRMCCANAEVPRKCLNWCRGEPIATGGLCALQHTRSIIGCFQSNRDRLPGPPQNLAATVVSDSEVLVRWDPPIKNPHVVDGYRIFYHEAEESETDLATKVNSAGTNRIDVQGTSINVNGLKRDILYELVAKAGNQYGASVLTDPIRFTLGDHHITSASHSNTAGTISGILAGILAIILAIAAVLFYKKRRANEKAANGVAFENPSYLRGVEHVQIPTVTTDASTPWRQEALQPPASTQFNSSTTTTIPMSTHNSNHTTDSNSVVPMATEVNPSLYEELKLGHEGAGFKRWDPPIKNPHVVDGYRIFYHEAEESETDLATKVNSAGTNRIDVQGTSINVNGLKRDILYELVAKAGNQYGASVLTDPIRFTLGDHHITSASHSNTAGTISGILAGILAIILAIAAVLFYKKRRANEKAANGVAFENPSYLRGVEHVQIPTVTTDASTPWRQEALQPPASTQFNSSTTTTIPMSTHNSNHTTDSNSVVPMATEVNPSLYEELKLGHEGAGFKRWDPPIKNPHVVDGYRIFYHEAEESETDLATKVNSAGTNRIDVQGTSINVNGLKRDILYELVAKAGNQYGASVLTDPIRFTLGDHHITSASHSNTAGTISGILAGILAIILAIAAVLFYKKRRANEKAANGVAFENPSYLRGVEHVQIPTVTTDASTPWRQEALQPPASTQFNSSTTTTIPMSTHNSNHTTDSNSVVPMATEVNPSLYEELKLGHEGAGFKRLVS